MLTRGSYPADVRADAPPTSQEARMPRISIQHFRSALAARSGEGALVRAYRRLTQRPDLASGMVHNEWALWSQLKPATA
jgi:hypothetical protein